MFVVDIRPEYSEAKLHRSKRMHQNVKFYQMRQVSNIANLLKKVPQRQNKPTNTEFIEMVVF